MCDLGSGIEWFFSSGPKNHCICMTIYYSIRIQFNTRGALLAQPSLAPHPCQKAKPLIKTAWTIDCQPVYLVVYFRIISQKAGIRTSRSWKHRDDRRSSGIWWRPERERARRLTSACNYQYHWAWLPTEAFLFPRDTLAGYDNSINGIGQGVKKSALKSWTNCINSPPSDQ